MSTEARRNILNKIAGRLSIGDKLRGKKSRKEIEKYLSKLKQEYFTASSSLRSSISQLSAIEKNIEEMKAKELTLKSEMKKAQSLLNNMDFAGSSEVKIETNDVAYLIDGKYYSYDPETNEVSKFVKNKKKEDEQSVDDEELSEGVDVNIDGVINNTEEY
jgi:hypothetical protein